MPDRDDEGLDAARLREALATFGGSEAERRAVARAARDLTDAGPLRADRGVTERVVTVESVLDELRSAPDGGPADRWNWWVGSLVAAYGDGYARFGVGGYESGNDRDVDGASGR